MNEETKGQGMIRSNFSPKEQSVMYIIDVATCSEMVLLDCWNNDLIMLIITIKKCSKWSTFVLKGVQPKVGEVIVIHIIVYIVIV